MAKDVRQALLYADRGEVDAALVYRTDDLPVGFAIAWLLVFSRLRGKALLDGLITGSTLCFARSLGEFGALSLCLVSIVLSYLVLMANELLLRKWRRGA